jgi:2-polyprenyl-6-methoxyphenol hydroxylase-like FAD-dependent oxidoreductase
MNVPSSNVRCCIAGGGPAGMMLGFLLARAGIEVLVLEKHADFFRDFRGDTIHPSTLQILHEAGLLPDFLRLPHQEMKEIQAQFEDEEVVVADFSHLPTVCRFIAFMPQWDFLNFLTGQGKRYPAFHLKMEAEVTELIEENGRVAGVKIKTPQGIEEVRADLVVGADGRHSTVRARAGLPVEDIGAPIDVLWMRLSRRESDQAQPLGRFGAGGIFVMINREKYWQCGLVIPKGGFEALRREGLPALHEAITAAAPFMKDRVSELRSWDDVKLLTVKIDRLRQWSRPGVLCIGDAAHAMSPVGGVGINLAIQDAVAAANLLAPGLQKGRVDDHLDAVQRRRAMPVYWIQRLQVFIQNRVILRRLSVREKIPMPWGFWLLQKWPVLRRIPARIIGLGVRPEHVRVPEAPRN